MFRNSIKNNQAEFTDHFDFVIILGSVITARADVFPYFAYNHF